MVDKTFAFEMNKYYNTVRYYVRNIKQKGGSL